ncbi:MAG: hypothetical protein MJ153_08070 [Clostridia bacterium]|nr:hypothetical protein [Clostridia bacterium]
MYVFAKFSKGFLKQYANLKESSKDSMLECRTGFFSFADAVCEGIIRNWNGRYELPDGGKVSIEVKIIRYNGVKTKQRYITFKQSRYNMFSHVTSPVYRWVWGLIPNKFHLESAGFNWSPRNPGTVYLCKCRSLYFFEQTAAHEFGHVLGLGDTYGAWYRFFYDMPGTENYMMYHNYRVSNEEITMMLRAQAEGKMQYFPYKFSFKHIRDELKHIIKKKKAK